ncbi:MAG: hypothetical protein ACE5OW_00095 [Candidatus Bathyarchaeia archaeon]
MKLLLVSCFLALLDVMTAEVGIGLGFSEKNPLFPFFSSRTMFYVFLLFSQVSFFAIISLISWMVLRKHGKLQYLPSLVPIGMQIIAAINSLSHLLGVVV